GLSLPENPQRQPDRTATADESTRGLGTDLRARPNRHRPCHAGFESDGSDHLISTLSTKPRGIWSVTGSGGSLGVCASTFHEYTRTPAPTSGRVRSKRATIEPSCCSPSETPQDAGDSRHFGTAGG